MRLRRILQSSGRAARVPAPEISLGCNAWFAAVVAAAVLVCSSSGRLVSALLAIPVR